MKMTDYFNLTNFNPDLLDTSKIKHIIRLMKHEYISYWQNALQQSQKLEFYRIFKTQYIPSNCLDLTRNTSERRVLYA